MYTLKELEKYTVKQLKLLADYDGKKYPKYARKNQMIDLLVQMELPDPEPVVELVEPCSVRVQRIRDSVKEN